MKQAADKHRLMDLFRMLPPPAVPRHFLSCRFRSEPVERLESRIAPAVFIVNSVLDVGLDPDDGIGSLREAILSANANAGVDMISFNIPGSGVQRIAVTSELPAITEAVVIDGFTQPGATPNTQMVGNDAVLLIELHGGNAGLSADGLILNAGGSTIRGLVINGFESSGMVIQGGTGGNVVEGNFIGTDASGTTALLNGSDGIDILDSPLNRIGGASPAARNLISGNNGDAIFIDDPGSDGTIIQGNYLGTNAAGTAAIRNDNDAIFITDGADNTIVGGALPGEGNLISGNDGYGVSMSEFSFPSSGNQVLGNFIGTDATGLVPIPNLDGGISIFASSNNLIGGTVAGAGNRIAFNLGSGLDVFGGSGRGDSSGNAITGNTIIGNSVLGINMSGDGVFATSILANQIGTDGSSTTNLGNEDDGIRIRNGAHDNAIDGNEIAFNLGSGIALDSTTRGTFIRGNSIHDNQALGIDLNDDGITPNDTGDSDVGANDLINFPVITSAVPDADGELHVSGTINSTPNTTLRIELFRADASTFQGAVPAGFIVVTTDASGTATFETNTEIAVSSGYLTATATDENAAGTSEFGAPFHLADAPIKISPNGKSVTFADIDGDRVTIRLNKGELRPENFVFGGDGSLQKIDLLHDPRFPGANLSIDAKATGGGNGVVDVGFIDATDIDLGKVVVSGTLGQIVVGDGDPKKPALKSLTVGALGTAAVVDDPLLSEFRGTLGKLTVKADVRGAAVDVTGKLGKVKVGGDLVGDKGTGAVVLAALLEEGGIVAAAGTGGIPVGAFTAGSVGSFNVKGNMNGGSLSSGGNIGGVNVGNDFDGAALAAAGQVASVKVFGKLKSDDPNAPAIVAALAQLGSTKAAGSVAIDKLEVRGNVENAQILLGYKKEEVNGATEYQPRNPDASSGKVVIGGDWIATSLVAGVSDDANDGFGRNDEVIEGDVTEGIMSKIASIVIKGTAVGSATAGDHFGIVAQEVGKLSIAGEKIALSKDAKDDVLLDETNGDFRLLEVGGASG